MTNRILDLSEQPARLRVKYHQLLVEPEQGECQSIPLDDIAVLVVSHAQVRYTHAVLSGLATAGGVFITCNHRSLPVGMMMPLDGHGYQVTRFAEQAAAALPLKKRLWQQVVRAKLTAQATVLEELHQSDAGIRPMISQVRSGDPNNLEAQAARRYWPKLFANRHFRRNRDAEDQNQLLNYGYAVLRAIVARGICAAGLHPSLGLHHHNRQSTYPLADDLMEPLRPLVDRAVAQYVGQHGLPRGIDRDIKRHLISAILGRVHIADEHRTIFDSATRTAASLARVFAKESREMDLPQIRATQL